MNYSIYRDDGVDLLYKFMVADSRLSESIGQDGGVHAMELEIRGQVNYGE